MLQKGMLCVLYIYIQVWPMLQVPVRMKSYFMSVKNYGENIVTKQMYVTGAIGATQHGEAFTFDYDLPNDTIYAETCAAIGLIFFSRRMFEITKESKYMDVVERCLFNGVISGMSLDGKRFFYVNPFEVNPEASEKDYNKKHVKPNVRNGLDVLVVLLISQDFYLL